MTMSPERANAEPSVIGALLFILFGPLTWGAQFTALYLAHTLLCVTVAETATVIVAVAVITVLPIGVLAWAVIHRDRLARPLGLTRDVSDRPLYDSVHVLLSFLSGTAIIWSGWTAAAVTAC
jgi:hypothetical protein